MELRAFCLSTSLRAFISPLSRILPQLSHDVLNKTFQAGLSPCDDGLDLPILSGEDASF
jgi:hypothetical protein